MGKGKDSPRKSPSKNGKSKRKVSPPTTPTGAKPSPPIKERELVPYFAQNDPEGMINHCVLPPAKKGSKAPRSTRGNLRSPGKNRNKSNSPSVPTCPTTPDKRLCYSGPAFMNSPDPETLPHPSFLLSALSQPPAANNTCQMAAAMDPTTHLKLLLKLPVA